MRGCLRRRMGGRGMACACAWWASAVGVGATTGVVTVTMPSSKLQVSQVTEGKRARGWTSGSRRLSGFNARIRVLVLRAGASTSLEGVGVRMAWSLGRPRRILEHSWLGMHC